MPGPGSEAECPEEEREETGTVEDKNRTREERAIDGAYLLSASVSLLGAFTMHTLTGSGETIQWARLGDITVPTHNAEQSRADSETALGCHCQCLASTVRLILGIKFRSNSQKHVQVQARPRRVRRVPNLMFEEV